MPTRRDLLKTSASLAAISALGPISKAQAASTVSYWHHFTSQSEMDGLATISAMFDASGHSVQSEGIPNAQYMSKVTTATVADGLPDTMMVTTDRLPDIHAMNAIEPITDRVNGWDEKSNFADTAWENISLGGDIYGIPAFAFVNWAYYRKDWVEEAGLELPTTMEEFGEAAIALTDPSQGRYGFGMRGGDGGQGLLLDVMESFGGIAFEDGKAMMDTDKARQAIQFFSDLAVKHNAVPPSAPNDSYRQIMEGFKTGQTGLLWHHTGSLVELTEVLSPDQIGTMVMPAGPSAHIARVNYLYNSLTGRGDVDAAWDWIAHWGNPDAAVALLEATGYFPATSAVATHPDITGNPIYQAAVDTLSIGVPSPKVVGLAAWMKNTMLSEYQKVLVGTATVEVAVDAMARGLEREMR